MRPMTMVCTAGIARPSAHGQVMMRTAIAVTMASCQDAPNATHPIIVRNAAACTTGA